MKWIKWGISPVAFGLLAVLALSSCQTVAPDSLQGEVARRAELTRTTRGELVWITPMFETWHEQWVVGYRGGNAVSNFTELVQKPDTVDRWTELLTLATEFKTTKAYSYPGGVTFTEVPAPKSAAAAFEQSLQARCATPVRFQQLAEDDTPDYPSIIFVSSCERFKIGVNPSMPEFQMHRVIQGKDALYHFFRIRHAADVDAATQERWLQGLKAPFVCDYRIPAKTCPTR